LKHLVVYMTMCFIVLEYLSYESLDLSCW